MNYFVQKFSSVAKGKNFIKKKNLIGFNKIFFSLVGDVLEVFFFRKGSAFVFEGICLAVRGKNFKKPGTSLVLRNFINNVGIECSFSYFYNRIYTLRIHDYKRKFFFYNKAKIFFLRNRMNKNTKII
jgi:ribosomal protein L19